MRLFKSNTNAFSALLLQDPVLWVGGEKIFPDIKIFFCRRPDDASSASNMVTYLSYPPASAYNTLREALLQSPIEAKSYFYFLSRLVPRC